MKHWHNDRGMDKEDVAHTHKRNITQPLKNNNNDTCSNIDEPRDYYTKKSQRQIIHRITHMRNLKCDPNELIHENRLTDKREQTCACQGGGEWEREGLGIWNQQVQTIIYRMENKILLWAQRTMFNILWEATMEKNIYIYVSLLYLRNLLSEGKIWTELLITSLEGAPWVYRG